MNKEIEDLRDDIAIIAMQALIRKSPNKTLSANDHDDLARSTALGAYGYADAMLKVRNEK